MIRRLLPLVTKPNTLVRLSPLSRINYCSTGSSKPENKSDENSDNKNKREHSNKPKEFTPVIRSPFEAASEKTKENYLDMVTIFENRDVHRRNHVEFIYAALKNMEDYGIHQDIEVYKALINVMPKGKFIPTNIFQAEFMHYPKQQQCIIDLLEQMEDYGVIPDYEMEAMLLNIFGRRGHPLRKYWRMMYWMPKFKNLSPWPVPNPPPNDTLDLAQMAIQRMATVDLLSRIDVFDTKDVVDAIDQTWIVSAISPIQSELLQNHNKSNALYIEGPFQIWLRNKTVNYFTLRGDPDLELLKALEEEEDVDTDDLSKIRVPFFGRTAAKESRISKKRSVHEQDDGTIYAICATGTSTKDSLLSWIRLLEETNPVLGKIPVLFKFRSIIDSNIVPISNELR